MYNVGGVFSTLVEECLNELENIDEQYCDEEFIESLPTRIETLKAMEAWLSKNPQIFEVAVNQAGEVYTDE